MSTSRFLSLAPLQIAQALIGFGAIAAFTRLMSPEDFGRYALALSISMAAHTLMFTWAEAAAFRFFAAARAEKRLADHFATLLVLALALGLGVVALTAGVLAFVGLREDIAAISLFAAGAAVLRFITRLGRESDRAALAFGRYAILETVYLVTGFAVGVGLLIMFDFGAVAPFAGLLAAGALVVFIDLPRLLRNARGGEASVVRSLSYAGYGTPLALALAADLGVQAIARLVLAGEAGTAPLGAYAAAFGLARSLDIVFMGVSAAFAPLVFAAYEENGPEAARDAARGGFVVLAAITVPGKHRLGAALTPDRNTDGRRSIARGDGGDAAVACTRRPDVGLWPLLLVGSVPAHAPDWTARSADAGAGSRAAWTDGVALGHARRSWRGDWRCGWREHRRGAAGSGWPPFDATAAAAERSRAHRARHDDHGGGSHCTSRRPHNAWPVSELRVWRRNLQRQRHRPQCLGSTRFRVRRRAHRSAPPSTRIEHRPCRLNRPSSSAIARRHRASAC